MSITKKEIKATLGLKMSQLNDVIADIDHMLMRMENEFFRVSIFGSARIKKDSKSYKLVHDLAYQLATKNVDIVTGGGPGLMDAANSGAILGGKKSKSKGKNTKSIGLSIVLPYEEEGSNVHLDVKREHRRFSSRLDDFMRSSHAAIITEGGIGTLLELLFTWQLIQAKHIKPRPIILLSKSDMWKEFIDWIKKWPLKHALISENDMDNIIICNSLKDVIVNLEPYIFSFYQKKEKNKEDDK